MRKFKKLNENLLGGGFVGGGYDNTLAPTSYSVQGQGPGYVYAVLPMTDTLQQKANDCSKDFYIYAGCTVTGHPVNNRDKEITGYVTSIIKNSNGEIIGVKVRDISTNMTDIVLDVENLHLNSHTKDTLQYDKTMFQAQHNFDLGNGGMITNFNSK